MLTGSNVRFFEGKSRVVIDYNTKNLDNTVLETLKNCESNRMRFELDPDKLHLVNMHNKLLMALLYDVDLLDQRVGWLLAKMCVVSDNLGFIISPMARWYRHRVIEIYRSIKGGLYRSYIDLDKFDEGIISLVIEYNLLK